MNTRKYWPLDYDPECEIYDNPTWNLPGYRRSARKQPSARSLRPGKRLDSGGRSSSTR